MLSDVPDPDPQTFCTNETAQGLYVYQALEDDPDGIKLIWREEYMVDKCDADVEICYTIHECNILKSEFSAEFNLDEDCIASGTMAYETWSVEGNIEIFGNVFINGQCKLTLGFTIRYTEKSPFIPPIYTEIVVFTNYINVPNECCLL